MPRISRTLFVAAALSAVIASACATSGGLACAAGDYRYCDCAAKNPGYARCADDSSGYGACDCSGAIPAGAGVLVEAGAADAGRAADAGDAEAVLGAFLVPCAKPTDCESNLCFAFNAFGPHCTKPCAKDIDCPAPSPGCSNMKVCKLH